MLDEGLPHLIVPGWGGSEGEHWQVYWQHDLEAERVELDNWFDPQRDVWIAALDAALARLQRRDPRPPVLLAHSLGCITVAHYSAAMRMPIAAALLVAPADVARPTCPAALRDSGPVPLRPLRFLSLVVTSDDDPYVSLHRAEVFAAAWGSELRVVRGGGHLNVASQLRSWPEGRRYLASLLAASA